MQYQSTARMAVSVWCGVAWRVCVCVYVPLVLSLCAYAVGVFASGGATTHSLCGLEVTVSTIDRVGVDILLFCPFLSLCVCLVQEQQQQ